MTDLMIYAGLFITALLAASILPLQSEAVLTGLLIAGNQPVVMLVITASVGNIAGSAFNWWLGSSVNRFRDRKWFPVKEGSLSKAENWYQDYGRWSLLLSWVPVIGDPLTMAAGVMREPLWSFLVLVAIAKTVRYIVLALVVLGIMG